MEAIAEDRGSNPLSRTVEVQVEVVDRSNKPPVWDDLDRISRAVYVKENTAVGETVTTVRARSEKSKKDALSFFLKKKSRFAMFFYYHRTIRTFNVPLNYFMVL